MLIGRYVTMLILAAAILSLNACSFKLEFGYHGETGVDNRTATQQKKG